MWEGWGILVAALLPFVFQRRKFYQDFGVDDGLHLWQRLRDVVKGRPAIQHLVPASNVTLCHCGWTLQLTICSRVTTRPTAFQA